MILGIIAVLLFLIFASMGRRDMERYFEKNSLPDGTKVNLYTWAGRGMGSALVVLICVLIFWSAAEAIGWALVTLLFVSWGGPYIEYAITWNRAAKKR